MTIDSGNQSQSIRKTLNIQIGIVVASIGIITGLLFFSFSFQMERKDFNHSIALQEKLLSDTLTQQLWLLDYNTIEKYCLLALDSPYVNGMRLLDHNRTVVFEGGSLLNEYSENIAAELRHQEGTLVGYIEIYFIHNMWRRHQTLIIIAGCSMMVLIIFASYLLISTILKRHLVEPLSILQDEMKNITSGIYDTSQITDQKAEIQNIIDGFNQMAKALSFRERSQKEVESKLFNQKKLFETMFNTIPDSVIITNNKREIILANKGVQYTFGYNPSELYGKGAEVLYADHASYVDAGISVYNIDSLKVEDLHISRYRQKNGTELSGETFAAKLFDENNEWIGNLGIIRDITEREQVELRMQHAQRMESIGNLAGGIAHDFNNLLSPIIGMSELLLEDLPRGGLEHENVLHILKAGERCRDLVKQILAFSRQSDQEKRPTRVQHVLKEVIKLSRSTIPSDIEIEQDIQKDCGLVTADPTQIHQVAMNLITNAFHAVEKSGGKIKIELKESVFERDNQTVKNIPVGKYVVLRVSDNGSGIEAAIKDKIFDPYFTTKEKDKGTGLGLAVVYGIIQEYGGDVLVESKVGKGTAFSVYIPLIEQQSQPETMDSHFTLQTGSEHILLVDDEGPIVRIQKLMLERLGYKVTSRTSSLDALECFRQNPDSYDLLITDMTMPNITGDRLAQEIKSIRPGVPIIICTGFSERINRELADSVGINGFLMKPVVRIDMAKMIRQVLDDNHSQ